MLELYLLVRVGAVIGPLNTLLLVLVTGFVGAWLARSEGLRVLRQWQRAMQEGRMPEDGVLSGLLVLVGGVLLITPGIFTDLVGLWLLLPFSRRAAARVLRSYVQRQVELGNVQVRHNGSPFGGDPFQQGPFSDGPFGRGPSDPRRGPGGVGGRRRPGGPGPRRPPTGGDVIDTSGEEVR